jgi:hypothetical protein
MITFRSSRVIGRTCWSLTGIAVVTMIPPVGGGAGPNGAAGGSALVMVVWLRPSCRQARIVLTPRQRRKAQNIANLNGT